ncbi:MAG: proline dehydrogenase [Mariniphaga sp.]|nr:proline dehydrogenase [Mariniphaga sp.]
MIDKLIAKMLPLFPEKLVWIFSKRYISGQYIEDALSESRKLNQNGIMVTVDLLGEYIQNLAEADVYKEQYIDLIRRFTAEKVNGNFSVKPSMFGLLLDSEACYHNLADIVEAADQCNSFIKIDMEDSECTTIELEIFRRLKTKFPRRVGIVVQAYMRRTLDDVKDLMDLHSPEAPLNFRLCKGIYIEDESIAYKKYQEIRDRYVEDMRFMLENGIYVGIATHDKYLIDKAYEIIEQLKVPKDKYEFQMLFGVAPKLRQSIVDRGHRIRVYVPFGKQWFNYSTRRLKENPNMVWHIIKAMFVRQ